MGPDSCSALLATETMPNNRRIFVVEDHATTARALKMFLETHGYDVTVADDVASALRFAKKNTFDLLICDLSLPLNPTSDEAGYWYHAATSKPIQLLTTPNPKILLLRVLILDDIIKVATKALNFMADAIMDRSMPYQLYLWHDEAYTLAINGAKDPYINNQPLTEAFWRTLIADRSSTTCPAPSLYGDRYEAFSKSMQVFHSPDAAIRAPTKEDTNVIFQSMKFGKLIRHSLGRKVATTKKGYMAMVPPLTQVGDTICIPLGAQAPFVLREMSGKVTVRDTMIGAFQLVGECYVHGVMNGEMADDGNARWIVLV